MSCDACSRSRPTVRPDRGCCPDTVVVADGVAFRQQPRPHLNELSFIEKELQQLVEGQVTATCRSVESTVSVLHVVIRVHTPTTDADVGTCPRRVRQPRAADVVEEWSQAVVYRSGNECLTRRRVGVSAS